MTKKMRIPIVFWVCLVLFVLAAIPLFLMSAGYFTIPHDINYAYGGLITLLWSGLFIVLGLGAVASLFLSNSDYL